MNYKGVVVHHSASRDVPANEIDHWHKDRGWNGIGYHFVIRKNGNIEPGRAIDKQGAHAKGRNKTHVGICLTGRLNERPPTIEQLASLSKLLRGLMNRYGFGADDIDGHHEECPGEFFPMKIIKDNLA